MDSRVETLSLPQLTNKVNAQTDAQVRLSLAVEKLTTMLNDSIEELRADRVRSEKRMKEYTVTKFKEVVQQSIQTVQQEVQESVKQDMKNVRQEVQEFVRQDMQAIRQEVQEFVHQDMQKFHQEVQETVRQEIQKVNCQQAQVFVSIMVRLENNKKRHKGGAVASVQKILHRRTPVKVHWLHAKCK